jgi:uncharacterized protein HemX
MTFEWYYELPSIFKAVIFAICIMIILMAIISGIYFLPKKNREMKTELLDLDRSIAKKKVILTNQLKEYADMVERTTKEKADAAKKITELESQSDTLRDTASKLQDQVEKLKKKVGGRPKKTS